jgi:hypothetical protein
MVGDVLQPDSGHYIVDLLHAETARSADAWEPLEEAGLIYQKLTFPIVGVAWVIAPSKFVI